LLADVDKMTEIQDAATKCFETCRGVVPDIKDVSALIAASKKRQALAEAVFRTMAKA